MVNLGLIYGNPQSMNVMVGSWRRSNWIPKKNKDGIQYCGNPGPNDAKQLWHPHRFSSGRGQVAQALEPGRRAKDLNMLKHAQAMVPIHKYAISIPIGPGFFLVSWGYTGDLIWYLTLNIKTNW